MPPAKKDAVAARSAAITTHMNKDHSDAVKALAQYHAGLDRLPDKAKMLSISSTGLELEFRPIGPSLLTLPPLQKLFIRFDKPLKADTEARPKMIAICQEADERRQKNAPILYSPSYDFIFPAMVIGAWIVIRTPAVRDAILSKGFNEYIMAKIGGEDGIETCNFVMSILAKVHAIEAIAMAVLCLRRKASLHVVALWSISTFFAGFTQFQKLFKLNPLQPEFKKEKLH
ncbi:hypothetical protein K437DRAFT_85643 [Tilletiaria anomala UBC 951]|uniref:DUF2470 domain-containing protein n=1 Tax=Tilletiaria anomala (strain ATCC 24038 / CBS 436.72 / UBC 951) TaxID=1037660 RepID=A0A066W7D3_TILAU|nr:uncharacterized protein K437DRAFT_85643 [Tilletiaria anomala UBC 951]KDN48438.1 hypothetical protein K437DRAFT_85643 [Tilletiaria anomala UBC 951]